ncbi:MAG TPA: polysaccharide deacetylase family protein, partial [Hyphomicrobiales bacterium]|nr:polysaccharide deacetylase family protein [Hyphomicrobiales bacterium]
MTRLSREAVRKEIEDGIAAVKVAAGDAQAVAPFFRFPYLEDNRAVDDIALAQGLMIWSVDLAADDWTRISPQEVVRRVIGRLEASHKGIILLHDIQQKTALALPSLLQQLKKRGYRIVQIIPISKDRPKTAIKPKESATADDAPEVSR